MSNPPRRMLITVDVPAGAGPLRAGDVVWAHATDPSSGAVMIEHRGQLFPVPHDRLIDVPVPRPVERLLALDPCFTERVRELPEVFRDDANMFAVLACRHDNLFLVDVDTGVAWVERVIFMGRIPRDADAYRKFWDQHHPMTTDELRWRGIGC